jgi:hypothetical protein
MADCYPYMEDYYIPENNKIIMTNEEKARVYDELLRENDFYTRKISKLKSEYSPNIPQNIQEEINKLEYQISLIVGRLESLFR